MKITIIGSNTNAAKFIDNCEIIDDYTKADIVIFSGNINWRSAVQKFNKIAKNKLIIVMDTNVDLFVKKYGGEVVNCVLRRPNQTQPVILLKSNIMDEAVVCLDKIIALKAGRKYITLDIAYINIKGEYTKFIEQYIVKNRCTLLTVAEHEDLPKCMFLQVDPNMFPKSNVSKYINEIVCEYSTLQ